MSYCHHCRHRMDEPAEGVFKGVKWVIHPDTMQWSLLFQDGEYEAEVCVDSRNQQHYGNMALAQAAAKRWIKRFQTDKTKDEFGYAFFWLKNTAGRWTWEIQPAYCGAKIIKIRDGVQYPSEYDAQVAGHRWAAKLLMRLVQAGTLEPLGLVPLAATG